MSTSDRLIELAERRVALRARIERQRETLGLQTQTLTPLLGLADRAWNAVNYVRQHPAPFAAAVTVAIILRPRRLFTWGQRVWLAWKIWRRLHSRIDLILPR